MNTSGSIFPSPATGSPQDVYAPGDSRIPFILGQDSNNKKLKSPVFRRKLNSKSKRKKY